MFAKIETLGKVAHDASYARRCRPCNAMRLGLGSLLSKVLNCKGLAARGRLVPRFVMVLQREDMTGSRRAWGCVNFTGPLNLYPTCKLRANRMHTRNPL
jgi:hypothetical protein